MGTKYNVQKLREMGYGENAANLSAVLQVTEKMGQSASIGVMALAAEANGMTKEDRNTLLRAIFELFALFVPSDTMSTTQLEAFERIQGEQSAYVWLPAWFDNHTGVLDEYGFNNRVEPIPVLARAYVDEDKEVYCSVPSRRDERMVGFYAHTGDLYPVTENWTDEFRAYFSSVKGSPAIALDLFTLENIELTVRILNELAETIKAYDEGNKS